MLRPILILTSWAVLFVAILTVMCLTASDGHLAITRLRKRAGRFALHLAARLLSDDFGDESTEEHLREAQQ